MGLRLLEFIIRVITTCVMLYISITAIMVYAAFSGVLRFPADLNIYSVQLISIILGITSAYFGIIGYAFDSYIDFTRIFIRLHNVIVLWVLFFKLNASLKSASLASYQSEISIEYFQTEDIYTPDMVKKMEVAIKRSEVNMIMLIVLNVILTLIFIWKVIKFILFYYMEIDI